ncbi:MAG: hypothetical protein OEZ39_17780 [Gammaproteobacteria bacterium]|nr:hypothetical protein [Gammaproteobacteria bacterium]MDH5653716.1 hypothetical protein [Gammaproteobacteria bacterium]
MSLKDNVPVHANSRTRNYLSAEELKNYIFFSNLTKGGTGKKLHIDARLLPVFLSAVDPDTHDGKETIRKIENLRGMAGQVDSLKNQQNAFDNMLLVKNLQIYYQVRDGQVYITNIKVDYRGDKEEMGLYNVYTPHGLKEKKAHFVKDDKLPYGATKVYISGAVSKLKAAVAESQKYFANEKYVVLFYCPSHIVNGLGIWKSSLQSHRANNAAAKLAEVINKNKKTTSTWAADGEGAALLAGSLRHVPGDLEKLTFQLLNPVGDSTKLLATLKQKQAKFLPQTVSIDKGHRPAHVSLLAQQPNMLKTVSALPTPDANSKKLRDDCLAEIKQLGGGFAGAINSRLGKTFMDIARIANKMI